LKTRIIICENKDTLFFENKDYVEGEKGEECEWWVMLPNTCSCGGLPFKWACNNSRPLLVLMGAQNSG